MNIIIPKPNSPEKFPSMGNSLNLNTPNTSRIEKENDEDTHISKIKFL
jgi:hypothetical protein